MQNWKDLYLEHAEMISQNLPEIKWIDLWHNQVNFLEEEYPFPAPATFLSYRILRTEDVGLKVQNVKLQVDIRLFYETFADTYKGSFNQDTALEFIDSLDKINALFHGSEGNNFSGMRRLGFSPEDTGNAGNLYLISYECTLIDYSATKTYVDHELDDIRVTHDDDPYDLN
jgi:hypothetical protein